MKDIQPINILSSRRSYEFRVDDIRLTLLSSHGVIQLIKQGFSFEIAGAGAPAETFGPVSQTIPPGLVFDFGAAPVGEGQAVAVRFLHIEQRRIVIDVAGPSSAIDPTYQRLRELLEGITTLDNVPALGEPIATKDLSEVTVRVPFDIDALVSPALRPVLADSLGTSKNPGLILIPTLLVQAQPLEDEYQGSFSRGHQMLQLELRAGSPPQERILFSAAPLNSDDHRAMLEQIIPIISRQVD